MDALPSSKFHRFAPILIRVFAPVGVLISLYLVRQHIEYETTGALNSPLCSVGGFFDCEQVEASGYSSFMGIPVASFGVVYFTALTLLAWFARPGSTRESRLSWQSLFACLTLPAFAAAWGLAMLSALVIDTFCIGCTAVYALVFLCTAAPALASPGNYMNALKRAPRTVIGLLAPGSSPPLSRKMKYVVACGVLLMTAVASMAMPAWIIRQRGRVESSATAETRIEKYFRQPVTELLPPTRGMTKGDPDAALRIVVFTDFRCGFCKKFNHQLEELLTRRPQGYFVSYKHFPLSRECNPVMKNASFDHAQACQLALVAEAMGDLGFFEEWGGDLYLDEGLELYPALKKIATEAGQEMNRWAVRSKDPDIREQVERDIAEGLRLGLRGVPAVFVNGRQLISTDPSRVEEILKAIESGVMDESMKASVEAAPPLSSSPAP